MGADKISLVILVVSMVLYLSEKLPVAVIAMGTCAASVLLGLASPSDVWYGFSSNTTMLVGSLMVVGLALIDTGVAVDLGEIIFRKFKNNMIVGSFIIIVLCAFFSSFMNNTAAVTSMLPVLGSLIVASEGKLHEKKLFLPLAVASNVGGMITLIGTTAQMLGQEILIKNGYEGFGFFEFAFVGLPMLILFSVYYLTVGKRIANKRWGQTEEHSPYIRYIASKSNNKVEKTKIRLAKQIFTIIVLVTAVLLMILTDIAEGVIGVTAALLVIIFKCINLESFSKNMDWSTIFVLCGGMGFANALTISGGGKLIVDYVTKMFSGNITPMLIFVVLVILSGFLTLFMSNTAVSALLVPIGMTFAVNMGVSIYPFVMGICMAANCSFSTPVATSSMTLVFGPGEYAFKDYLVWCIPLNILGIILLITIVPTVWPF